MKTLIAFSTETGNTKKLAQEIFNTIDGEKFVGEFAEIQNKNGFDIIYVGFPIHNFGPSEKAKDFISKIEENQKVILFATHAMQTESPMNIKQIENCRKAAVHLKVLDIYTCRGEMSESVAERMIHSDNPQFQFFGKMRQQTIGHPNQEELKDLREFVKETQKYWMFK